MVYTEVLYIHLSTLVAIHTDIFMILHAILCYYYPRVLLILYIATTYPVTQLLKQYYYFVTDFYNARRANQIQETHEHIGLVLF